MYRLFFCLLLIENSCFGYGFKFIIRNHSPYTCTVAGHMSNGAYITAPKKINKMKVYAKNENFINVHLGTGDNQEGYGKITFSTGTVFSKELAHIIFTVPPHSDHVIPELNSGYTYGHSHNYDIKINQSFDREKKSYIIEIFKDVATIKNSKGI